MTFFGTRSFGEIQFIYESNLNSKRNAVCALILKFNYLFKIKVLFDFEIRVENELNTFKLL